MNDFSWMVPRDIENAEWRWVFISSVILLVLITVPFVWAYAVAGTDAQFMGVLVQPIDGASYQAKMRQGLEGGWLFRLPYTPEPHQGVFLFTFYLAMGHLAATLNLPTITIFHAARLVGAMLMFVSIYRFVADWTSSVEQRRLSWSLAVLGAGFGWIALLFEHATPDLLTVPEAFPLQAAYANAHFPWALAAAMVLAHVLVTKCLLEDDVYPGLNLESIGLAAATVLLVSTSPFVLVPIGVGFAAMVGWLAWRQRTFPRRELAWGLVVLVFGMPFVLYNAYAISSRNPVIQIWMSQNITPSPPVWDYLIAFGPLLILAVAGIAPLRRVFQPGDVFLLGWLVSGALLLYAPIGLQRRFTMGLIIPLSIYAARGLWRVIIPRLAERRRGLAVALTFAAFMPTTVIAIVAPMMVSVSLSQGNGGEYFIARSEEEALLWLEENAPGAVVLASPGVSHYLPVFGARPVYGHPYETLNAEAREEAVFEFFSGEDCSVLRDEPVDYIWVGPRERELGPEGACPVDGPRVYESSDGGEVVIYAARDS